MAFIDIPSHMRFYGSCLLVACSLSSLGITKINSFNEDSRVARHLWTGCKKGGTVITPSVILAEVGCCYFRVILLDGLQNMLHYPANSVTFLGGVLYDVDHGLVLNDIFKLSYNYRNVPRNFPLSKPISLVLSKLLWQEFHSPVLGNQD